MLKLAFYALMGVSLLLNVVGAAWNFTFAPGDTSSRPTPTASPTTTPLPTPCYPDDPKKECPSPSPTAQPVPTTSPTMHP